VVEVGTELLSDGFWYDCQGVEEEFDVSETDVLVPNNDPSFGGMEVLLESETDVGVESDTDVEVELSEV